MAPTSIYQSFYQAVHCPNSPATQHVAHSSGHTTRECEPPTFLLETDFSAWEEQATPILRRHEPYLQRIFLPTRETNVIYNTEGDVVAGATLQLTHPVHMALSQHVPSLLNGSEVPLGSVRADKVYLKQSGNQQVVYCAVLDYKKMSTIVETEFRAKIASNNTTFKAYMNRESQAANVQDTNTENLLKQGVHYSKAYDTPFVAFFDMQTLVLLVFTRREGECGGDFAFVSIINQPVGMRRALLGFLSLAAAHKGMDEYKWQDILVSKELRGWFKGIGKTWLLNPRRSDRLGARNTR
ncbi:hypothetical protein ACHAPX_007957 [Trichoderma viride]